MLVVMCFVPCAGKGKEKVFIEKANKSCHFLDAMVELGELDKETCRGQSMTAGILVSACCRGTVWE